MGTETWIMQMGRRSMRRKPSVHRGKESTHIESDTIDFAARKMLMCPMQLGVGDLKRVPRGV